MAFGLPSDRLGQSMVLLALLGVAAGYLYYDRSYVPRKERIATVQREVDSLQHEIELAKAELAKGSVEDLRRRLDEYRASLDLMRRLVPARNEVPNLLDDMAARAKIRGVHIADWQPMTVEPGTPFDTYRYRFQVVGKYDQVGDFVSDVASLDRIIVPLGVIVERATAITEKAFQDTTGTLLKVTFSVRTFVKSAENAGGTGGAP